MRGLSVRRSLALSLVLLLVTAQAVAAKPPDNNSWRKAAAIGGVPWSATQSVTGAGGGGDPTPPCTISAGASVWFAHTAAASHWLLAHTNGATTYDTVLAVWEREGNSWRIVACDDDGGDGLKSMSRFIATEGTTYYFQVAEAGTGKRITGEHILELTLELAPS